MTLGVAIAAPSFANADCPPGGNPAWLPFQDQDSTVLGVWQGYSTQPQKSPDGQGTSSITRVTTTNGFTNPAGKNPCIANTTSELEFSGPGNSPAEQLLGDRVDELE